MAKWYRLRLKGKAKDVFRMLNLLAKTAPEEDDPNWWALRLWLRRN